MKIPATNRILSGRSSSLNRSHRKSSSFALGTIILVLVVGSLPASPATAQDITVKATIVRLQGRGIYLNVGREVGIQPKDTLSIASGTRHGLLRVIGSSSNSSLTTWVGKSFKVALNDELVLVFSAKGSIAPTDVAVRKEQDRVSILSQAKATRNSYKTSSRGPNFSGRLLLSMSALQSKTKWNTTTRNVKSRTFATPTVSFRGVVSNLPGGAVISLNTRMSYRYSSNGIIASPTSIRLYQVSLTRSLPGTPLDMELGRFSNSTEPGTGYWDGVILKSRGRHFQFGTALGLEPDKFNEGFRSDLPKYSAFVSMRSRFGSVRSTTKMSVTQLNPQNEWRTHSYIGLTQKLRANGFSVSGDFQFDRHPETGKWIITRLKSRGALNLTSNLRIDARFSVRQPYAYWRTSNIISYRRDQSSVGMSYGSSDARLGISLTTNTIDSAPTSTTYAVNFSIASLPFIRTSLSGSASYWSRNSTETVFGSANLSRTLGGIRLQLLYNYYQATLFSETVTSHTVGASAQIPVRRNVHASLQTRTQFGQQLTSTSVFASLWVSF